MNWLDRTILTLAHARGFVLGQAVVDRTSVAFGHDTETFSPAKYGDYIATSNGVYACASLRADLLSSLPLALYRVTADGERVQVNSGKLFALLQKVNPFWTINRLLVMTELSLCLWGKGFWFLERGDTKRGMPREIWWARPDRVRVVPDVQNYVKGFLYRPLSGTQDIPFEPSETIWLRYPNPLDEYEGLSPLAAARIAADYASAAWKTNRNLFENGLQIGGTLSPKTGTTYTGEQAKELEEDLARRFKGVDKAHRWAVLRFEAELQQAGINMREAEFVKGLAMSLEDIARAYKVPLDLVGGQRTYENVDAALKAVWSHAILPEARFVASELTEQLLPMFGEADLAEFDASDVDVLQEAESERWTRAKEQIGVGAITINEWRDEEGLESVPWGDVWWASLTLVPITNASTPASETLEEISPPEAQDFPQTFLQSRTVEFGSPAHERLWQRFIRRTEPYEKQFSKMVTRLFERQRDSVLAKLKGRAARDASGSADNPFDKAEWIKKFRTEVRPLLLTIVEAAGIEALGDLEIGIAFDVKNPLVLRFLEKRAQRFAKEVNDTTWNALKASLAEGIDKGESIAELAARVEAEMGDRIRSSSETIARTEVISASSGGTLAAWEQSGVVKRKEWLAALDERTRETHIKAHGQQVDLDKNFRVGVGSGSGPGLIDRPEESINCRCALIAVLETEKSIKGNGHLQDIVGPNQYTLESLREFLIQRNGI